MQSKTVLTFVTSNPAKAREIQQYVRNVRFEIVALDLHEIQSLDLREVVEHKAYDAYKRLQKPVIAEDTSLVFHALGRLPGPLIKWFLKELRPEGLCQLLDAYSDRHATASVFFGVCDGEVVRVFEGNADGSIAPAPRGAENFGWDSVFIPRGAARTWGEMTLEEKWATSMRRQALEKLDAFFHTQ